MSLVEKKARSNTELNNEISSLKKRIYQLENEISNIKFPKVETTIDPVLYQTILNHTHIPIAYLDEGFNFLWVNQAYALINKKEPAYYVGKNHFDFFIDHNIQALFQQVVKTGVPHFISANKYISEQYPDDGSSYWDLSIYPVKKGNEKICNLVLIIENITERIQTKNRLNLSEQKYYQLFNNSILGMAILQNRVYSYINTAYANLTGYTRSELLALSAHDVLQIIHPDDKNSFTDLIQNSLAGENISHLLEFRFITKDKKIRFVHGFLSITEWNNEPALLLSIFDITDQKKAELIAQRTEELWHQTFEAINDSICIIDNERRIIRCNQAMTSITGQLKDNIISKTCCQIIHNQNGPLPDCPYTRMTNTSQKESSVFQFGDRYLKEIAYPLFVDKELTGAVHIFADITQQKQAERALMEKTLYLNERVKELNCLYRISRILKNYDASLTKKFQDLVDHIPPGWQFPEITCARLIFKELEFCTANFSKTKWKLSANLIVNEYQVGFLEVYYLEPKPESAVGPFLAEEINLINELARQIGETIELKEAEDDLKNKNIALSEVIAQIETEKKIIKENVFSNINELVIPLLNNLKNEVHNTHYISILEKNLLSISSSFGQTLKSPILHLTPREIAICNYIRTGLSSKEIATLLGTSSQTVEKQRKKIRKKLGIRQKSINLSSYLRNMT